MATKASILRSRVNVGAAMGGAFIAVLCVDAVMYLLVGLSALGVSAEVVNRLAPAVVIVALYGSIFFGAHWASRRGAGDGMPEALLVGLAFEAMFVGVLLLQLLFPYEDEPPPAQSALWDVTVAGFCVAVAYGAGRKNQGRGRGTIGA